MKKSGLVSKVLLSAGAMGTALGGVGCQAGQADRRCWNEPPHFWGSFMVYRESGWGEEESAEPGTTQPGLSIRTKKVTQLDVQNR